MFVGAVPMPVVNQLLRAVDCTTWHGIYVCCSGSFRVDRALKDKYRAIPVHSNDVSMISCALGELLTGGRMDLRFVGRLAFMEDVGLEDFESRVAAAMVALEFSRFSSDNAYARGHFDHGVRNFPELLAKAKEKVTELKAGPLLDGYFAGDFRDHAQHAIEQGAGICGFMPTYKGGYERMYRFVDENVQWEHPKFRTWDPKDMPTWLASVRDAGVPYFVYSDQAIEGFQPTTEYRSTINKPVYGYMSAGKASFRRELNTSISFAYEKADPATLGPLTDVQLVRAATGHMNFLRSAYLAKGIAFATGIDNYLVMLDGKLAGGFIYSRDRFDPSGCIYLLSDFCIVHERRMAKLIAMLAVSYEPYEVWCRRTVSRPKWIYTTAFTDKPVSMKYRGIYELANRKEGMLNYRCALGRRERTAKAIYLEWLGRFGQPTGADQRGKAADADRAPQPEGAAAAEEERALHG
jgi:hypothetical protein